MTSTSLQAVVAVKKLAEENKKLNSIVSVNKKSFDLLERKFHFLSHYVKILADEHIHVQSGHKTEALIELDKMQRLINALAEGLIPEECADPVFSEAVKDSVQFTADASKVFEGTKQLEGSLEEDVKSYVTLPDVNVFEDARELDKENRS